MRLSLAPAAAALCAGLAAAPASAADCAVEETVGLEGPIAALFSNMLGVQVFLRPGARASCHGFERLELSFKQAEACVEGGWIEGSGRAAMSDLGRRAVGGRSVVVVTMDEVRCLDAPPPR